MVHYNNLKIGDHFCILKNRWRGLVIVQMHNTYLAGTKLRGYVLFLNFMCMSFLPIGMSIYPHACSAHRDQKRALIVSHHVGARNKNQILWKSN